MSTRKATPPREVPDRVVADALKLPGRSTIEHGDEISIAGVRGRCVFLRHVTNTAAGVEWVDVLDRRGFARTFRPDRIRTVHRTTRTGLARTA